MRYGEIRGRPDDLEAFEEAGEAPRPKLPHRINLDSEKVERGLAKLVLTLVELLRRLLEKQALRRIEAGRREPSVSSRPWPRPSTLR